MFISSAFHRLLKLEMPYYLHAYPHPHLHPIGSLQAAEAWNVQHVTVSNEMKWEVETDGQWMFLGRLVELNNWSLKLTFDVAECPRSVDVRSDVVRTAQRRRYAYISGLWIWHPNYGIPESWNKFLLSSLFLNVLFPSSVFLSLPSAISLVTF